MSTTAHWRVAAIWLECPFCGAEQHSYTESGYMVPIGPVERCKPGREIECQDGKCQRKFRLPSLKGAHGPEGRGYS